MKLGRLITGPIALPVVTALLGLSVGIALFTGDTQPLAVVTVVLTGQILIWGMNKREFGGVIRCALFGHNYKAVSDLPEFQHCDSCDKWQTPQTATPTDWGKSFMIAKQQGWQAPNPNGPAEIRCVVWVNHNQVALTVTVTAGHVTIHLDSSNRDTYEALRSIKELLETADCRLNWTPYQDRLEWLSRAASPQQADIETDRALTAAERSLLGFPFIAAPLRWWHANETTQPEASESEPAAA